jgi:hypothetical protein
MSYHEARYQTSPHEELPVSFIMFVMSEHTPKPSKPPISQAAKSRIRDIFIDNDTSHAADFLQVSQS